METVLLEEIKYHCLVKATVCHLKLVSFDHLSVYWSVFTRCFAVVAEQVNVQCLHCL